MTRADLLACAVALMLFAGAASASETSVTLRDYIEALMEERDQQLKQQRQDDRLAIETALRSEIRIKDEEGKSRYALKAELNELRDRIVLQQGRVAELEGSRVTQYVGILILAIIGVINLMKPFWDSRKQE